MVPGLKTGRLRKKTLTQPETDSPAAIPLGSPVAPSPVVPVRSNVGPSHHVTSQPMDDSDETQAPSETQPSGVGTSKPLRVRGPTLGKGIQKIIRANKGEKCYVHIDRGLNAMTGKYATPATNELGIQIRTLCPLKDVKSWLDLDFYWKMVPGLKTSRLRKKTLTQPETDSPAAIPLGSPIAPSPVLPV
ncbi:uncharacterized protein LOC114265956 [Camellia sinensis]|uniref:uncharacterized protein LOC114265956 n=1 Tax=Camellia sinensis TaxID=4442 RepID=UPI00103684DC|nr:uncharacterized protein LOC114265956 [Camellia sinensis]